VLRWIHIGSELTLISEVLTDEGGWQGTYASRHVCFTNEENVDPLAFRVDIESKGQIMVTARILALAPVTPLMVRDTERTKRMVQGFTDNGVLVVGLNSPVVPEGGQTIRFQINAAHTEADVAEVLGVLERIR